jgi:hypothetical protein
VLAEGTHLGIGHGDDLVPRPHAGGEQGQLKRVRTAFAPDRVGRAQVAADILLKPRDRLPEDVLTFPNELLERLG